MTTQPTTPFLIIDLEATCWEGPEQVTHAGQGEIIEIGLAIVSATNELQWQGGWFVRPIASEPLSDFCTKLTSITQADIQTAPLLPEALNLVAKQVKAITECELNQCTFVSWGKYDRSQFERDCARHSIAYPFGPHINLKQEFMTKLKRAGLSSALTHLGLTFTGTLHRGADDAANIARIFMKDFGPGYEFST